MKSYKKILALAPHVDDIELGCGATISKFVDEGKELFYVAFSLAIESIPKGFSKDSTRIENKNSTLILGIESKNLIVLNYKVRRFCEVRQYILEDMIKLKRDINPDLVFVPSSYDIHQDHSVIYMEAYRAFKYTSILGYELIQNTQKFNNDMFISVSSDNLRKKISSVQEYKSQKGKSYMNSKIIESLALIRGVQSNNQFAESFEVIRWN